MADNTTLNTGSGGDVIGTDDISSVKYQRIKLISGADGTNDGDVAKANPLPVMIRHDSRTFIQFWAVAAASGTTGTETTISLTKSAAAGAATTSGTSFVVTSGKRFRITNLTVAMRGNATTGTITTTTFSLRVNTGGAVTTSSNIWMQARTAIAATAGGWDRMSLPLGGEGFEVVGDGTLQIGITANSVFVTNVPTWDVFITGYEY